jgi:hypothetical protein
MAREPTTYRAHLEDILEYFHGARMLAIGDVREYLGVADNRTVKKHIPACNGGYISAVALAHALAEFDEP